MQSTSSKTTCTTVHIINDSAESGEKICLKNSCFNNRMVLKVLLFSWDNIVEKVLVCIDFWQYTIKLNLIFEI